MFHFYTPWKHQKASGFLMFSGVSKWNISWKWVKNPLLLVFKTSLPVHYLGTRCDLMDDSGSIVDSTVDQEIEFRFNLMLDSLEDWKVTINKKEHEKYSLSGEPSWKVRSSHRRCSVKKVLLKVLQYSQEDTCVRVFFDKVKSLNACNFIRKRLWHRCFPVSIAKMLKTPTLKNIWERLRLKGIA